MGREEFVRKNYYILSAVRELINEGMPQRFAWNRAECEWEKKKSKISKKEKRIRLKNGYDERERY